MTLAERISLIRPGVTRGDGAWADLGAGAGAFTAALASLLGPGAVIHAVDRDRRSLLALEQELALPARSGGSAAVRLVCVPGDFTAELPLPPLDGALIANALHFHSDHGAVLAHVRRWLVPGAVLIVVEYDVNRANPWVPHPLPWQAFADTAERAGFTAVRLLGRLPSAYHGSMYAAACTTGPNPALRVASGT